MSNLILLNHMQNVEHRFYLIIFLLGYVFYESISASSLQIRCLQICYSLICLLIDAQPVKEIHKHK